jgi:hypothetical protein
MRQTRPAPKCKRCGKACQWYSPMGGYSVQCKTCNELSAAKQRERRARSQP